MEQKTRRQGARHQETGYKTRKPEVPDVLLGETTDDKETGDRRQETGDRKSKLRKRSTGNGKREGPRLVILTTNGRKNLGQKQISAGGRTFRFALLLRMTTKTERGKRETVQFPVVCRGSRWLSIEMSCMSILNRVAFISGIIRRFSRTMSSSP